MLELNLMQWVGRTETHHGGVSAELASMAHATMAVSDDVPQSGQEAPALWHWAAFNAAPSMDALAEDGHPRTGGFLPPLPHPRRMWAGGAVTFHKPLKIDAKLRKVSTILVVDKKSDALTLVTVRHQIYENETLLITERQDIAYLPIPDTFSPPRQKPVPTETIFELPVDVSPPLLFRYSALTFNAHRIHYDLPYAQTVEKYPGLVVHGPLQATLLLNAAIKHSHRTPREFVYRGVHPMFHDNPLHLFGHDESADEMRICTGVPGAHQGMQATVKWRTDP